MGGDGLAGCSALTKEDHILIFFTQNAKKLDMRDIADHGEAAVKMIEIPAGKQSADIHIGSFLGYLAGKNMGRDCRIVVISQDTDFDNVLQFWEKTTGIRAYRMRRIREETQKQKKKPVSKQPFEDADETVRKQFRKALQNALREADFAQSVCDAAAELAVQCFGAASFTEQVHNALQSRLKDQAKPVYRAIKPVLTEYGKLCPEPEAAPQNADMVDALQAAGATHAEALHIAEKSKAAQGRQDARQQVYKFLVAAYGQDKGLRLYNAIKKKI